MRSRLPTLPVLTALLSLAFLTPYLALFLRSMIRTPSLRHFVVLLSLWQTQVTGLFAIVAALIGAAVVLQQTAEIRKSEERKMAARARALRAVLVLSLMELYDYSTECLQILADLQRRAWPLPIKFLDPDSVTFPPLPTDLINRLTDLIENTSAEHARPFVLLMQCLQTHHGRIRDIQRRAEGNPLINLELHEVEIRLIDAAELRARCDRLLIYARQDTSAAPNVVLAEDVKNSLVLFHRQIQDISELRKQIDRKAAFDSGWPRN